MMACKCVLKGLQEWKEAPVDVIALSTFRLAQFYILEVRRGRCGLGNYMLRQGLIVHSSVGHVLCAVVIAI